MVSLQTLLVACKITSKILSTEHKALSTCLWMFLTIVALHANCVAVVPNCYSPHLLSSPNHNYLLQFHLLLFSPTP